MNKKLSLSAVAFTIAASLLLTSCTETTNTTQPPLMTQPQVVKISSLDDLNHLFETLDYSGQNWNQPDHDIPRITFKNISDAWAEGSSKIPVETKKSIFFRLMTPLSLLANEKILSEREIAEHAPLTSTSLTNIALKYRVIDNKEVELTEEQRQTLLTRVDIIPTSLVLAQSAEESGWGTSRFALEGNAFFGQWDFSGKGMKPKKQREALGNYGVASFDSPLDSVEAYMLNLNTNPAYNKLRILRTEMRSVDNEISGYELASTLDKYSERGQAYVEGIRQMIRFNKLHPVDHAKLINGDVIHLINVPK